MKKEDLTYAELVQLETYVKVVGADGWYYGQRIHFCNRHQRIMEWIERELAKRTSKGGA